MIVTVPSNKLCIQPRPFAQGHRHREHVKRHRLAIRLSQVPFDLLNQVITEVFGGQIQQAGRNPIQIGDAAGEIEQYDAIRHPLQHSAQPPSWGLGRTDWPPALGGILAGGRRVEFEPLWLDGCFGLVHRFRRRLLGLI